MSKPHLLLESERSATVRAVVSDSFCVALIHYSLDGEGGVVTELSSKHINGRKRLAPGVKLYVFSGVLSLPIGVLSVDYVEALMPGETMADARNRVLSHYEIETLE